jgi:hypothetical protein
MQSFRIPDLKQTQLARIRQDAARGALARYDAAFAESFAVAASLASSSSGGGWDPTMCPEVAAGYWWSADRTTGFGTTDFRVVEGNGRSTFDLVQATVARQPTVLTEFGGSQFRMRDAGDANPCLLATAATVQAGWTGPTYMGMWVRVPDASGDVTSACTLLMHNLTTGNQRRIHCNYFTGVPDTLNSTVVEAGVAQAGNTAKSTGTANASWHWVEVAFDLALQLGGSSPGDVTKHFSDFTLQALTTVPTTAPAVIFDALAKIFVATQNGAANTDTTDWAACYYANGIPSLADRVMLARWNAPTTPPR